MLSHARASLLVLAAAIATGCGAPRQRSDGTAGQAPLPGNNATGGVVLSGPDLYEHGGTLLAFLYGRISGMTVDYSPTQPCPRIQIRGRKSLVGSSDPVVYVDGARTANSCVLEMLNTRDLSRVEVYPMGVTNRPGYKSHPNGLILVFQRDGSELVTHPHVSD